MDNSSQKKDVFTFTNHKDVSIDYPMKLVEEKFIDFCIEKNNIESNTYRIGESITLIISTTGKKGKTFLIDLSEQKVIFEDFNGKRIDNLKIKHTINEDIEEITLKAIDFKPVVYDEKITVTDDKNISKNHEIYLKDTGGIWIYSDDINRYRYRNKSLYDILGNKIELETIDSDYVKITFHTLNGLIDYGADPLNIIKKLEELDELVGIKEINWYGYTRYSVYVYWPDKSIIITHEQTSRQCPALALIHELGHAYVHHFAPLEKSECPPPGLTVEETEKYIDEYNKWFYEEAGEFPDQDEKFVVTKIENPAIDALNKRFPDHKTKKRPDGYWTHKTKATGGPFSIEGGEIIPRNELKFLKKSPSTE